MWQLRGWAQNAALSTALVAAGAVSLGMIDRVDGNDKTPVAATKKAAAKTEAKKTGTARREQRRGGRPDLPGESKPIVKGDNGGYPDLPLGITSFGGAVDNDAIYLYGGHTGTAHGYSVEDQSDAFLRLDLKNSKTWEKLPSGPRLQGLALVAHAGKVYRIGGFSAKNKEGEKQSLWSTAEVAAFDIKSKTWQTLSPMPTPRSSHDAAVVDGKIYVVGGWSMQGPDKTDWATTALVADLSKSPLVWKKIATPPFERRALSVAGLHHKLFAVGGMQKKGGITRDVDVYDPATNTWSKAPSLTGGMMDGFGTAAFEARGALYVSTYKGLLQKLDLSKKSWIIERELANGRFFHRMLPDSQQRLIVVGGANMRSGKYTELEVVDLAKKPATKPAQKETKSRTTQPGKNPAQDKPTQPASKKPVDGIGDAFEKSETPVPKGSSKPMPKATAKPANAPATQPAAGGAPRGPRRSSVQIQKFVKPANCGLPDLPEAVTSFGSTIVNDAIYVYGGHKGLKPVYTIEDQSDAFLKLDINKPTKWEKLASGPKLQGLALVGHGHKVYRVGGFTAKNKRSEKQNLWSVTDVAVFDTRTGQWETLPPLPTPRSSHDAAVIDGKLYVVGGWLLQGSERSDNFHSTMLVADLSQSPLVWKEVKAPFERRALSVAGANHKLYVIGGMKKVGGISREVDVYDPATGAWSKGPTLNGGMLEGFGSAAYEARGALYVSTHKGTLQRLDVTKNEWVVDRDLLHGRFFHRMLPDSQQRLIVVGGSSMGTDKFAHLEIVDLTKKPVKKVEKKPATAPSAPAASAKPAAKSAKSLK